MSKLPEEETIQIGYVDDDIPERYAKAIRGAKNIDALYAVTKFYKPLTDDAVQAVLKMKVSDFGQFKIDAKKAERAQGKEAERIVDRWGDILMPERMLEVTMTAQMFGAPFGTAFIRMQETGKL